jgi:hypothetical protein
MLQSSASRGPRDLRNRHVEIAGDAGDEAGLNHGGAFDAVPLGKRFEVRSDASPAGHDDIRGKLALLDPLRIDRMALEAPPGFEGELVDDARRLTRLLVLALRGVGRLVLLVRVNIGDLRSEARPAEDQRRSMLH